MSGRFDNHDAPRRLGAVKFQSEQRARKAATNDDDSETLRRCWVIQRHGELITQRTVPRQLATVSFLCNKNETRARYTQLAINL
jgi:hypothetical protein